MRLASLRAQDAVALLAAAAVAALFAVAATSLGREGEALLLQWGAPRDGKAFIWGPPTMRPDRQALSLGKGTRGRTPRIAPQAGAGQRMPSIRVLVNQNHDEGDRIEPVNINIQLPGTGTAAAPAREPAARHDAARVVAESLPARIPAAAVDHVEQRGAEPAGAGSLDSESAVDAIDADGDPAQSAGLDDLSPFESGGTAVGGASDAQSARADDAEAQEAAAVFSPEDFGAAAAEAEAEEASEAPDGQLGQAAAVAPVPGDDKGGTAPQTPPPLWLVGSPGHPHAPHAQEDGQGTPGQQSGRSRGRKHSSRRRGGGAVAAEADATHAGARTPPTPTTPTPGLAQLADEDAVRDVDNLDVRTDGSAVVPLPALAALSGRQLVALEGTLKFEERDARDDALSMTGVDRARKLSAQLKRVRTRLARMPEALEQALAKNERDMASARAAVGKAEHAVTRAKARQAAAVKEAGPKRLQKQERDMQAKVELQRAAAKALADVLGKPAPSFTKLPSAPGGSDEADDDDVDDVAAAQAEVADARSALAGDRAALAALKKKRASLLKDTVAVGAAVRADGAGREFGDQAELAAGRLTMLAASAASAASVAEDEAAGSSSVWTQVDEAVNPSYQNEVKARHAARKQLAAGAEGVVKAVAAMSKKPKFKTVDPQKDGWAPGRAEKAREVKTPYQVKQLATPHDHTKEADAGPKLQFCEWGSELVPCAPGYGGAWFKEQAGGEDHGIWDAKWPTLGAKPKVRSHVKAGRRGQSYLSDMFSYGSAGIFGAHAPRGGRGGVYAGSMLSRRAATGAQGTRQAARGSGPGAGVRRHKTEAASHSTQHQHTYTSQDRHTRRKARASGDQARVSAQVPRVSAKATRAQAPRRGAKVGQGARQGRGDRRGRKVRMADLVKEEWDWRLRHQNAASPEFVETLLKGARRVHQSQRLAHVRDAPTASVGSLKVKGPGSLTGSRRVADLDARLGEAKAAEMANLDRLAHVSLT